jgi:8-amino-7-oxononanoate synthase
MSDKIFETYLNSAANECIMEKAKGLYKHLSEAPPVYFDGLGMVLQEAVKPLTRVRKRDGSEQDMIMLGSNSFLGINTHPRIIEAVRKSYEKYGYGAGSPPLYSGQTQLHVELEERLAAFLGTEKALIFPSGYSGNLGVISGLCRENDIIICDSANHASIFDGAILSGAKLKCYLHQNTRHLEKILKSLPDTQSGRLIISDGVFSMEGSFAAVDEICELGKRYGAKVMIDDAHGFFAVGKNGGGTASTFGCVDKVDIHYGTFSKALGTVGGFCAGSAELIEYLKYYARSYFFSSALPASIVAGVLETIKLLEEEPEIIENLHKNMSFFKNSLDGLGFNTMGSKSAIVPILIGDTKILGLFQNDLFDAGIFSNIGTTPAVSGKTCRLRLNVMANHTKDQLQEVIDCLEKLGNKYGIL